MYRWHRPHRHCRKTRHRSQVSVIVRRIRWCSNRRRTVYCWRDKPCTRINRVTMWFTTNTVRTVERTMNCQGLLLYNSSLSFRINATNRMSHISLFCCDRSTPSNEMKDEIYEVDADMDLIDEEMTRSQADSITKQGYLYKGPDTSSDRMFAHIGSKSFKRR